MQCECVDVGRGKEGGNGEGVVFCYPLSSTSRFLQFSLVRFTAVETVKKKKTESIII